MLFIDEVTVLARNLERERPGGGDAFLHLLRRFRQDNSGRLATVLSGSIGFHHVSEDALSSVNDIRKVTVGPIRHDHATYLAECLLLGTNVPTTDRHLVAESVAAAAENVPYYIQHLVAAAAREGSVQPHRIAELLSAAIIDPHDPWDLRHYRDRLRNYYGDDAPRSRACSTSTPTPHHLWVSMPHCSSCKPRVHRSATATSWCPSSSVWNRTTTCAASVTTTPSPPAWCNRHGRP